MLSCKQMAEHADALIDGGAPLRQRLAMRLHLLLCDNCRRYLRQLRLLVGALRRCEHEHATPAEVEAVVERVRRER